MQETADETSRAAPPEGARCAVHPESAATVVCARCGSFACADCRSDRDRESFCLGCVDLISPLADPGRRLGAHLIDILVWQLPVLMLAISLVSRSGTLASVLATCGAAGTLFVMGLNARWVHLHGQSIGKRILKLRVVAADGDRMGLWRIAMLRNVLPWAVSLVPVFGWLFVLADPLLIFGQERRTLHDRMAGSIVVSVRSGWASRGAGR